MAGQKRSAHAALGADESGGGEGDRAAKMARMGTSAGAVAPGAAPGMVPGPGMSQQPGAVSNPMLAVPGGGMPGASGLSAGSGPMGGGVPTSMSG